MLLHMVIGYIASYGHKLIFASYGHNMLTFIYITEQVSAVLWLNCW